MATYPEQIAQWRVQRRQQEANSRLQELREEHAQAVRERDIAVANNDLELAASADDQAQYLEGEYRQLVGPQQQQVHPQWQNWIRRNASFIEREGQRGVRAVTEALGYMQRPRNPNTINPQYTGMGMTPQQIFTPQGLDKLEDLLETHGGQFYGVKFDKNEQTLTPNEARDASGLDTKTYNAAYAQLKAAGRVK
jgi:hypothetical protein